MKPIIFTLLLIVVIQFSFTSKSDWILYQSKDGIEIYTKTELTDFGTHKHNMLIFKYKNTTNKKLQLNFQLNLYYNNVCRACNLPSPNEYEMIIYLDPNQSIEGNGKSELKKFAVFHSALNNDLIPLDKFEMTNWTVKSN